MAKQNKHRPLPLEFYQSSDVVGISRHLLGKYLFTRIGGILTGGFIVEAEAYNGAIDRASHAYGNRLTTRTSPMFQHGGISYVYLCYGIHEMFNIVTSAEGEPHAVLVRAIEPVAGLDEMARRRGVPASSERLTSGPGSVARALGISRAINGVSLQGETLWLEDRGLVFPDAAVVAGPRVGVAYAGNDAHLPYRFYVKGNLFVSKPRS